MRSGKPKTLNTGNRKRERMVLTDGATDDRARAPHSRPDAKVEAAVVLRRV